MYQRLLLLSALVTLASCASPQVIARNEITVASDLNNMPFAGVDANGAAIGRDVEMMQEIANRIGVSLIWERHAFDQLMPMVERGDVDAVCATLGVTPERQERMDFSTPYYRTAIAVVVRIGDGEPTSLAELDNKRIAGSKGTTSERAIQKLIDAIPITENEKGAPLIERLTSGDIDAAAMDGPAADVLVASSGGRLARLADDLDTEDYGIAVDPDQVGLVQAFDQVLRVLESSGWLDELNERYAIPPSAK
jgi:glutamine transport system substrate-binding protein